MIITDEYTWPQPLGPYNANACFDIDISPPLHQIWEYTISRKYGDGVRVGGNGKVFVCIDGTGIIALDVETGKTLWRKRDIRLEEEEFFLAENHLWTKAGGDWQTGYLTYQIDLQTGEPALSHFALDIQGVFEKDGRSFLLLREGDWDVQKKYLFSSEYSLFGRVHSGHFYGTASKMTAGGDEEEYLGLIRFDLSSKIISWQENPQGEEEYVIGISDKVLITYQFESRICTRSAQNGQLLWDMETSWNWDNLPSFVISEDLIYYWEEANLLARDSMTGTLVWKIEAKDTGSNLILTGHWLWVGMEMKKGEYQLMALHKNTGSIEWSFHTQYPLNKNALTLIDDKIVLLSGFTIICLAQFSNQEK